MYGIKKLYDFTKDDIGAAAPGKEALLRMDMIDRTGTMTPTMVAERKAKLQVQIDNLPPEDREGYVAPEELSIEEQNLNNVIEEFNTIERQQEAINNMTPEQQSQLFNATQEQQQAILNMTPEQREAFFRGETIEISSGEANNVIVEGTANGQIMKTTNGSFIVTDPISGKQVDFPSEEFAQRALNGEYNYETGKFTDRLGDPPAYNPNSIDPTRLEGEGFNLTPASELQSSIVPTGDAIYNVGGAGQLTNSGGTTVINNNTTNNTAASPSSQIAIAIDAAGARSNSHTLKRKEDMRFMA